WPTMYNHYHMTATAQYPNYMGTGPHRLTLSPYTTLFRSRWNGPRSSADWATRRTWWSAICSRTTPWPVLRSAAATVGRRWRSPRSEEHTSELQSRENLVCRLLLEKKKEAHRDDAVVATLA